MKKIKPILFSSAMVEAILNDRKTQTRRIAKDDETHVKFKSISTTNRLWDSTKEESPNPITTEAVFLDPIDAEKRLKSKYQVGDILWVRETWCPTGTEEYLHKETRLPYLYKADVSDTKKAEEGMKEFGWKWKPSIFMPKEACRIFLEVTNVRVERLQDISEADAKAEGIQFYFEELFQENRYRDYNKKLQAGYGDPAVDYPTWGDPISSFKSLWQFINGWESWDKNPWVWVYDFKRVEKPENFLS